MKVVHILMACGLHSQLVLAITIAWHGLKKNLLQLILLYYLYTYTYLTVSVTQAKPWTTNSAPVAQTPQGNLTNWTPSRGVLSSSSSITLHGVVNAIELSTAWGIKQLLTCSCSTCWLELLNYRRDHHKSTTLFNCVQTPPRSLGLYIQSMISQE